MARARAAAETEMRRLLGSGTATITEVAEYKTQPRTGLAVLCGSYDLDGTSYRFVFLEEAMMILESQGGALASNMDEAFAGYCR